MSNRVIRSVLIASAVLLLGACASQPVSSPALAGAPTPLLEKKFQIAAQRYQKYQHEGQTVYCRKEKVVTSAIPIVQCLSEPSFVWRLKTPKGGAIPSRVP